jgi:hypothetical protein
VPDSTIGKHSLGELCIASLGPDEAGAFRIESELGYVRERRMLLTGARRLGIPLHVQMWHSTIYFWRPGEHNEPVVLRHEADMNRISGFSLRKLPIGEAKGLIAAGKASARRQRWLGESYIAALGPGEGGRFAIESWRQGYQLRHLLYNGARRMGLEIGTAIRLGYIYFWRETHTDEKFSWPPEQNNPRLDKHSLQKMPLEEVKRLANLGRDFRRTSMAEKYLTRIKAGEVVEIPYKDKREYNRVFALVTRAARKQGIKVRAARRNGLIFFWRKEDFDYESLDNSKKIIIPD